MIIVNSHKHNKEESASIEDDQIDYSLVRDTLYKYSKKSETRFLSNVNLSFMFILFSDS